MKAAFTMWKNSRMIILVAVCAAIYGAALIAFKTAIPFIPGITELRVGQIFPVAFGLLFGPAGAWGTAFGNFIGDLFGGTLGPGSIVELDIDLDYAISFAGGVTVSCVNAGDVSKGD